MKRRTSRTVILGTIFLILSVLYTLLLVPQGYLRFMDSYDILFHMNRIGSLGNILTSPVNFDYWGGVGNMTSLFYPWLTVLPGFLIFHFANDPMLGYLILIGVVTFCTFVSSYFFMKKFSENTLQSFLFSIIYTLAFFRMASVFYRAGVAEFICYIFIPMLFYEFYQLLVGKFSKWPLFALAFTLITLTHPMTAFTTVIIMVPILLLVLFSKRAHSIKYWLHLSLSGVEAIAMVLLTTIGFTLPMYQQQKYIPVNRPAVVNLAQTAKDPINLFQDALSTDLRNYSFGIIMILALIFLVIFIWKDKLVYKIVGIEMLLALLLSTNIIPWAKLQDTFFNYLQFPWRFLNLFTFFAAIYLSYGLARLVNKRSSLLKLLMMVVVLVGCGSQVYVSGMQLSKQITTAVDPNKLVYHPKNKFVQKYTQTDYYPQRSIEYHAQIRAHQFLVNGKKVHIGEHSSSNVYSFSYYSQEPAKIDIPVLVYKGLSVTINNEPAHYDISKRGTALLKTKPGQNKVQLRYHYSTVAKAALSLNAVALLVLVWLCINNGKFLYQKKDINKVAKNAEKS